MLLVLVNVLWFFGMFLWVPSTSRANWENTRWDMSLEELFSARPNLKPTTPSERRNSKTTPVGIPIAKEENFFQRFNFTVLLFFQREKLTGVRLDAAETKNAAEIYNDYKLTFGAPSESLDQTDSGCRTIRAWWRDEKKENTTSFSAFICDGSHDKKLNAVRILYQPTQSSPLKHNQNGTKTPIQ